MFSLKEHLEPNGFELHLFMSECLVKTNCLARNPKSRLVNEFLFCLSYRSRSMKCMDRDLDLRIDVSIGYYTIRVCQIEKRYSRPEASYAGKGTDIRIVFCFTLPQTRLLINLIIGHSNDFRMVTNCY